MILSYFIAFCKTNKIKIAILVGSIAIYFTLAVVIASLNTSLPKIATAPFEKIGVETVVQKEGQIPSQMVAAIFPHSNGPMYQDELSDLSQLEFVQTFDTGLYFWYFDDIFFKTVLGIEPEGDTFAGLLQLNIDQGEFSVQTGEVLITADFSTKNSITVGDSIVLGDEDHFTVVGILKANITGNVIPADIYMNIAQAQQIAYSSEEMNTVYEFTDNEFTNVVAMGIDPQWQGDKEAVITSIDENYIVFSEKTFSDEILQQIQLVSVLGKVMFMVLGLLLLIIFSVLIVYNFKTREKDIAVFRMIGWSFKDLKKQFMTESVILIAAALLLGNVLALGTLGILRQQTITMELPWELSAKPHFLPQENAIDRTITTPLPIDIDPWLFVGVTAIFLAVFVAINYIAFQGIKNSKPEEYLK